MIYSLNLPIKKIYQYYLLVGASSLAFMGGALKVMGSPPPPCLFLFTMKNLFLGGDNFPSLKLITSFFLLFQSFPLTY